MGLGGLGATEGDSKVIQDALETCKGCGGDVRGLEMGEDWVSGGGEEKYDYVDLEVGLLNLGAVADAKALVREVREGMLAEGGAVGVITHDLGADGMRRVKLLKGVVERNEALLGGVKGELAAALAEKILGYKHKSEAVAAEFMSVVRSFTVEEAEGLLKEAGFSVSKGPGERELHGTLGDSGGHSPLHADSILVSRNNAALNILRTTILRNGGEGYDAAAPDVISSALRGEAKVRDIYVSYVEDMNRKGNYLKEGGIVSLDNFIKRVEDFLAVAGGLIGVL